MNCNQVKENLSTFLDDELDPSQSAAIKAHLIRCADCRRERDKLELIGTRLRSIPPVTAPRDFEFQIYSRIRDKSDTRTAPGKFTWTKALVPMAAMIVGLLMSPSLFNNGSPARIAANADIVQQTDFSELPPIVENMDEIVEYKFDGYSCLRTTMTSTQPHNDTRRTGSNPSFQRTGNVNRAGTHYVMDAVPVRTSYEKIIY